MMGHILNAFFYKYENDTDKWIYLLHNWYSGVQRVVQDLNIASSLIIFR